MHKQQWMIRQCDPLPNGIVILYPIILSGKIQLEFSIGSLLSKGIGIVPFDTGFQYTVFLS